MGLYQVSTGDGRLSTIVRADSVQQALSSALTALAQILDAGGAGRVFGDAPADTAGLRARELNAAEVSELRDLVASLRAGT